MTKRSKPEPKPVGRPTTKTDDLVNRILARIADGDSVREILKPDDMPARSTWHEWLLADTELQGRYALAKDLGAESEFDEIKEIADDGTNDWMEGKEGEGPAYNGDAVQRSKLRVDARKWRLAKLFPKKYGDSVNLKHTGGDGEGPVELNDSTMAAKVAALLTVARERREADAAS